MCIWLVLYIYEYCIKIYVKKERDRETLEFNGGIKKKEECFYTVDFVFRAQLSVLISGKQLWPPPCLSQMSSLSFEPSQPPRRLTDLCHILAHLAHYIYPGVERYSLKAIRISYVVVFCLSGLKTLWSYVIVNAF